MSRLPDELKVTAEEQLLLDKEVKAMTAEFDKLCERRKKMGLPYPCTSYAGSWAHQEEFRARIRRSSYHAPR